MVPGSAFNDIIVEHGPRFVCLAGDRLLEFDHPVRTVAVVFLQIDLSTRTVERITLVETPLAQVLPARTDSAHRTLVDESGSSAWRQLDGVQFGAGGAGCVETVAIGRVLAVTACDLGARLGIGVEPDADIEVATGSYDLTSDFAE